MPINTQTLSGHRVVEIQYGGGGHGPGNRGFYIYPQPRPNYNVTFEYSVLPNPHGNPDYYRSRNQEDFYRCAGEAAVAAAAAQTPFAWQPQITFTWHDVNYRCEGIPFIPR